MTELMAWVQDGPAAKAAAQAGFDGILIRPSADAVAIEAVIGAGLAVGSPTPDGGVVIVQAAGRPKSSRLLVLRDGLPGAAAPEAIGAAGHDGVLLEPPGRLLDMIDLPDLAGIVVACRARGLTCGLAGHLEPPDVPRLLALRPDLLVVGSRTDPASVRLADLGLFRELVPRGASAATPASSILRDRIFVRDFVLAMEIGAYAAERGRVQRVRFTVEAEIAGLGRPSRDMRDVVSYDLITDTIRHVASEGHIAFVEVLAESIAERILAHPRIEAVRIVVEKLDLGAHSVGVEIRRGAWA